ncbi:hypothetical protein [Fodinicurvata sediminis]|uniref:hypothetical protein n=1 Tax=Fodinicurvata sediminis TaxID=1121832 RepID=UPI0003B3A7CA|nr:hypothetical protein [Fodinicurvata sediminis]
MNPAEPENLPPPRSEGAFRREGRADREGNTGSRRTAIVLAAVLVAGSLGLGTLSAFPYDGGGPYGNARMIGAALGGAFVPALVPLTWWGFRRFRADRSAGPLILWAVLLLVIAGLVASGKEYESQNLSRHEERPPLDTTGLALVEDDVGSGEGQGPDARNPR